MRQQWIVGGMLAVCVVGCGGHSASFQTTEEQRKTVHDNVELLANKFRAENQLGQYDLYLRGDSTISNECPQGDGWATVDLVDRKSNQKVALKCSTYSEGIGCMTEEDFKKKRYAQEDNNCNKDVPFPIPHIKQ